MTIGKGEILYFSPINADMVINFVPQKGPRVTAPVPSFSNSGNLALTSSGPLFSGEKTIDYRAKIVEVGGNQNTAKFVYSNDGGVSYKGWTGSAWAAYTGEASYTAPRTVTGEMALDRNVSISWGGSAGTVNDLWTFQGEYLYPREKLFNKAPNEYWADTEDNVQRAIVLDAFSGEYAAIEADRIAVINANIEHLTLQAHPSNSWTNPDFSQNISFVEVSGEIDATDKVSITDVGATWEMNEHKDKKLKVTVPVTGATRGIYTVTENDATKIYVKAADFTTDGIISGESYSIFTPQITKGFTRFSKRFVRLVIPAQETKENYYRIGPIGLGLSLNLMWRESGKMQFSLIPNIEMTQTAGGQRRTIKKGPIRRTWQRGLDVMVADQQKTLRSFAQYIDVSHIPFFWIPDQDKPTETYLVRIKEGPAEYNAEYEEIWGYNYVFEEEL